MPVIVLVGMKTKIPKNFQILRADLFRRLNWVWKKNYLCLRIYCEYSLRSVEVINCTLIWSVGIKPEISEKNARHATRSSNGSWWLWNRAVRL
jgi:hypothetical protein